MIVKKSAVAISLILLFFTFSPARAAYIQGSYPEPVDFADQWVGIPIKISSAPVDAVVTSIEVHCEISPDFGILSVSLSDEFYTYDHYLIDELYSYGDHISEDFTINSFNNMPVNQTWILWVAEFYSYDISQLDSWSIKVHYDDGSVTTYCNTGGGCEEYIYRVQVGAINNTSGCDGYADYSNISTEMQIGQNYPVAVINGDPFEYDLCGIWIDWNQDLDFNDSGESIEVSDDPQIFTAIINPPQDAILGQTKMRVRITYDQIPSPCGEDQYGEVEDYTIIVQSPAIGGDFIPPAGVDYRDFSVLAASWLTYSNPDCDIYKDYIIDYHDLSILAQNWLLGIEP